MKFTFYKFVIFTILTTLFFCSEKKANNKTKIKHKKTVYTAGEYKKLIKLQKRIRRADPGGWLYYKNERGQSYNSYINSKPIYPYTKKNKIYILPIGKFTDIDKYVIEETADFMTRFFGLETVIQKSVPSSIIPKVSRRKIIYNEQLHTKYILNKVLPTRFPKNAIVYTAITSKDLYPKESWNFVFGQANLRRRVGVSSIFRFKYEKLDSTTYHKFLKRVMRTTTHEATHMFSLKHCKDYKCLMNGSISLEEADSKPTILCHECLMKVIWCTNNDPIKRYKNLREFFEKHNFLEEKEYCNKALRILQRK